MKTKGRGYFKISGLEKASPEEIKARNLETYGSKIRKFRKQANLSVEELAGLLQISRSAVQNWECGITRPDPEYLYRMFSILDVEPNAFFDLGGVGSLLTQDEKKMLQIYRTLDDPAKEDLEAILVAYSNRVRIRKLRAIRERIFCPDFCSRSLAAGDGEDWYETDSVEHIPLYKDRSIARADEIFVVNGHSMEPIYSDGDRVLVEYCTSLRNGEIGAFYVYGRGGVIKQKAHDRLHSINPEYDDVFPYEEGAKLIGRVLGKITDDMIPSPEDLYLYIQAEDELGDEG